MINTSQPSQLLREVEVSTSCNGTINRMGQSDSAPANSCLRRQASTAGHVGGPVSGLCPCCHCRRVLLPKYYKVFRKKHKAAYFGVSNPALSQWSLLSFPVPCSKKLTFHPSPSGQSMLSKDQHSIDISDPELPFVLR